MILPTSIFQGRAVELRGCKCSSYIHNITPMMIASAIKALPLPQPWQSKECVCFQPLETSGSWQDSKLEKLAPKPKGFSMEKRCHTNVAKHRKIKTTVAIHVLTYTEIHQTIAYQW